jgi:uncharacterized ferritin-like protein (DUF455 family)
MSANREVAVELRAFAERVLFGADIEADKLADPGVLRDAAPGAARPVPDAPARPRALRFGQADRPPVKLATAAALEAPESRGQLLHAFANHELLALELMALAVLRFPDAPRAWRLGLGATMRDEQRHLRLYLQRMRACGTDLGDVPVSTFFWRCIADVPGPLDFAVRMGLVLEQANLDFALHHRRLFGDLGDAETAAVLDTVYADEIRHLRHGLHWFDRLRPPGEDAWTAFEARLAPPLSAARGKGPVFDAEGRAQAGMDPDFIARMRVFRRSRGRPPTVHLFHPGLEEAVAHGGPGWRPEGAAQVLAHDLAWLPALLAREDDVVLVPAAPGVGFRVAWLDAGLPLPEAVGTGGDPASVAGDREWGPLRPWGASPALSAQLSGFGALPVPDPVVHDKTALPPLRAAVRAALGAPDWVVDAAGTVCTEASSVFDRTAALLGAHAAVVWKAPFSTSGRHRRRVFAGGPDAASLRWLDTTLAAHGRVLVEPWLERTADLSVQLEVGDRERVLGWTAFETTRGGRWTASRLPAPPRGLDTEHARLLTGDGQDPRRLDRVARALLQVLGPWLRRHGHTGPVGVDVLVARTPAGLALYPLVEVNPRQTMGQLALTLRPHLAPGVGGRLHLLDAKALGGSPATHAPAWAGAAPLTRDDRGQWTGGRLLLTDPAQARRVVAAVSLRRRRPAR